MCRHSLRWAFAFLALVALAIPWFLWGNGTVVWGLPIWLWWHVGWLGLASVLFWLFARTDWGLWVVDRPGTRSDRR